VSPLGSVGRRMGAHVLTFGYSRLIREFPPSLGNARGARAGIEPATGARMTQQIGSAGGDHSCPHPCTVRCDRNRCY
jgi:hypothetical protein